MKTAISQVCSLQAPFETDLADYSAGACGAVEVWLGKLETFLEHHPPDDVRRLAADAGVELPVASFQGGLWTSQGEARAEHWRHFTWRLELCRQLGIGTLVVAGDIAGPLSTADIGRVQMSLVEAGQAAEKAGVRLAFEFQAQAALANNLESAAALIAESGQPSLGLCLDAFHFCTGRSKTEDLAYLTPDNLFHVQLCDVGGCLRELATDSDRILPGDGAFHLQPIVERLRQIDYQGYVSLETPNPSIWQISPRVVGEVGMTALRRALGQASMG
jgi:4-hydroxyphenylpyruvate dioxygenase